MSVVRIAHIADSHYDEHNRLEDNVAIHDAFLRDAEDAGVSLILHSGDVYERKSTPRERNDALCFFARAAHIAPVVVARGNHDYPGDLDKFHYLERVRVFEEPGVVDIPSSAVRVIALPWFDRARIAAAGSADDTREMIRLRTIAAAQAMLGGLRARAADARAVGLVPVLVGHVQVAGCETSTGQTLIGQTVELDPGAIAEIGCEYAALGHIHKHQSWYGGRVCYAGSPTRNNYGEPEPKGWVLVTIEGGQFVSAEFRELPARRIELREIDLAGLPPEAVRQMTESLWSCWNDVAVLGETFDGALVRLRYRCAAEQLPLIDEAAMERQLRDLGAHEVKMEAVVEASTRVRCEDIVTATTLEDKVRAYLHAKQITIDEAQWERLVAKIAIVEGAPQRSEVGAA